MYDFVKHEWFGTLFPDSRSLPLEIVCNTDILTSSLKNEAIDESIINLHRVLSFSHVEDYLINDDAEEFWIFLIIRIEDISFYASLLLPYLRQVIEENADMDFTHTGIYDDFLSSEDDEILHQNLNQTFEESQVHMVYHAIKLSRKLRKIEKEFCNLCTLKEFNSSCFEVYRACAEFIRLSYMFMLPNTK